MNRSARGSTMPPFNEKSGTLRWEFSKDAINSTVNTYSAPMVLEGMSWCINLFKSDDQSHLGICLTRLDNDHEIETVDVEAQLKLINHNDGIKTVEKEIDETFTNEKACDWGILHFIKWKTVTDESKGFIKNGNITVVINFSLSNICRSQKMRSTRKGSKNTPAKSQNRKSLIPSGTDSGNSAAVLKPIEVIRDLKILAASLPIENFSLPTSMYTREAVAQSSFVRGLVMNDKSTQEAKSRMLKQVCSAEYDNYKPSDRLTGTQWQDVLSNRVDIFELKGRLKCSALPRKKDISAARSTPTRESYTSIARVKFSDSSMRKAAGEDRIAFKDISALKKPKKEVEEELTSNNMGLNRQQHKDALETVKNLSMPRLIAAGTATHPPIYSIISLKPVDPMLLRPAVKVEKAETTQKKFSLESLVNKLSQRKNEDSTLTDSSQSSCVPSNESSSFHTPTDSSLSTSPETKKNKRKSSDPIKIISDEEAALLEKQKRKPGGRKRKRGGRKPPPKKRKVNNDQKEKEKEEVSIEMICEDEGLPPRIVVVGQEPGTELEWDEEEIIILRWGEQPEQRPPKMKRRERQQESGETRGTDEETEAVEERDAEHATVIHEDEASATITLDASQSTEGSVESMLPPSDFTSQSSFSSTIHVPSPTESNVSSQILSLIDAEVAETPKEVIRLDKRDSIESISSLESSGGSIGGRARRTIRVRARYSPNPEDGPSTSRAFTPMKTVELHVNNEMSSL